MLRKRVTRSGLTACLLRMELLEVLSGTTIIRSLSGEQMPYREKVYTGALSSITIVLGRSSLHS